MKGPFVYLGVSKNVRNSFGFSRFLNIRFELVPQNGFDKGKGVCTVVGLYNLVQTVFESFLLKISFVVHPAITALPLLFIFLDFFQNIQVLQFIVRLRIFFILGLVMGFFVIFGLCETQKIGKSIFKMLHSLNFLLFLICFLLFAILFSLKFAFFLISLKLCKAVVLDRCKLDSFEGSVWLGF